MSNSKEVPETDMEDLLIPKRDGEGYITISCKSRSGRQRNTRSISGNLSLEIRSNMQTREKEKNLSEECSKTEKGLTYNTLPLKRKAPRHGKRVKMKRSPEILSHQKGINGDEKVPTTEKKATSHDTLLNERLGSFTCIESDSDEDSVVIVNSDAEDREVMTVGNRRSSVNNRRSPVSSRRSSVNNICIDDSDEDGAVAVSSDSDDEQVLSVENRRSSSKNAVRDKPKRWMKFRRCPNGGVRCSSCKTRFACLEDFSIHCCSLAKTNSSCTSENIVINISDDDCMSPENIENSGNENFIENMEKLGNGSIIENMGTPKNENLFGSMANSGNGNFIGGNSPPKSIEEYYDFFEKECLNEENASPVGTIDEQNILEETNKSTTSSGEKRFHLRSKHKNVTSQYQKYVSHWVTKDEWPSVLEVEGSFKDEHFPKSYSSLRDARERQLNKKYVKRSADDRCELVKTVLEREKRTGVNKWLNSICPICSMRMVNQVGVVTHLKKMHLKDIVENDDLRRFLYGDEETLSSSVAEETDTQNSSDNPLTAPYSSVWDAREKSLNKKYSRRDANTRRELVKKTLAEEKRKGISEWANGTCPVCFIKMSHNAYVVKHLKNRHSQTIWNDHDLKLIIFGDWGLSKKSCSLS